MVNMMLGAHIGRYGQLTTTEAMLYIQCIFGKLGFAWLQLQRMP